MFGSFSVIYSYSVPQLAYSSSGGGDSDDDGNGTSDEEGQQQEGPEQADEVVQEEVCNDGIDNDGDELVDGEDTADCAIIEPLPIIPPDDQGEQTPEVEICDDGIDNDADGLVDEQDTVDCVVIQPFPTIPPDKPIPTTPSQQPPDNRTAPANQTTSTNVTAAAAGTTAQLVVTKKIVGAPPGAALPVLNNLASNFNIQIIGNNSSPSSFSGPSMTGGSSFSRTITLSPGDYEVTETRHTSPGVAAGFTPSYSADCSGTIAAGEIKTCTVTNIHKDLVAKLIVKKEIVRLPTTPRTVLPSFTIEVTGLDASPSSFGGSASTTVILRAGEYKVTESSVPPGYIPSYSADCSGTIAAGETKTCAVTNTDKSIGILKVIKKVERLPVQLPIPTSPSAFTIEVTGGGGKGLSQPSPSSFPGKGGPEGTTVAVAPGDYKVTETGGPPNWIPSYSADCTGTISPGETKTCTVTNTHRALLGMLTVIKQVINDDGGTRTAADFRISIGPANLSPNPSSFQGAGGGGTTVTLKPGTYSVTEDQYLDYTTTFTGECTNTAIAARQTKTCTIINDDIQPTLRVIKLVVNDNGGTRTAIDFNIQVTGTNPSPSSFQGQASPGTTVTLDAGSYRVTESIAPGYTSTFSADCSGSIIIGQTKTCVITNDDTRPGGPGGGGGPGPGGSGGPGGGGGPGPGGPGGPGGGGGTPTPTPSVSELVTENATVDVGTIKLGGLSLSSKALMRLATVSPLSIIGGHLTLNLPLNSNITIVAAKIMDNTTGTEVAEVGQHQFENAVISNLTKVFEIKAGEETLYQTNISSSMSGINPFTNRSDIVSNITDLLLWNSNPQKLQDETAIEFSDDNAVTMNIIYGRSGVKNIPTPIEKPQTIELDNFTFSSGGLLPIADISPFHLIGGNISLNLSPSDAGSLTTASNNDGDDDDINLIAAQINTDKGQQAFENTVIVNLTRTLDTITGETLRNIDLKPTINGINLFTGQVDTISDITNLFLWNSNIKDIKLDDKSAVIMTLVFE